MSVLYLEPTPKAQWFALVIDACRLCGYRLHENLEHYLVITLDKFIKDKKFSSTTIATEFLRSHQEPNFPNASHLREVGDHCLILSGLFPERALRKHVSLNYFIKLGKSAYRSISHQEKSVPFDPELFYQLSRHFVGMLDILHHMRLLKFEK